MVLSFNHKVCLKKMNPHHHHSSSQQGNDLQDGNQIIGDFGFPQNPTDERLQQPAAFGFLKGIVDNATRRELLAIHETFCQEEKLKVILASEDYLKADMEASLEIETAKGGIMALENVRRIISAKTIPSGMSLRAQLEQRSHPRQQQQWQHQCAEYGRVEERGEEEMSSGHSCMGVPISSHIRDYHTNVNSISPTIPPATVPESVATKTSPEEESSWIVRLTFYEQLLQQCQHCYNNQDAAGLSSLLFYPFCDPQVTRTVNFWNLPAGSSQQYVSSSSPSQSYAMQGVDLIMLAFQRIFDRLPDCMVFFHSPIVSHTDDETVVTLKAPYTYFFTMYVPALRYRTAGVYRQEEEQQIQQPAVSVNDQWSNQSQELVISSSSSYFTTEGPLPMEYINIELEGCLQLQFSMGNIVTSIRDDIFHYSASESDITAEQILRYMGF
jgi:hypothetical protein